MSTPLSDRERGLAKAWQKAAHDLDIGAMELMRVVTMLVGAMIIKVSPDRATALEGIRLLANDLTKEVDRKFPL